MAQGNSDDTTDQAADNRDASAAASDSSRAEESEGRSGAPGTEGPGCLPAVLAGTVLLGIVAFVSCGVTTWFLYQKRTEMATRTLEESYIPQIEQSRLSRQEKADVLRRLETLLLDLKRGQFEQWQAGAVMQRLVRLPVVQWGQLNAVEAFVTASDETDLLDRQAALRQLSRLRRGVELNELTSVDVRRVLEPVLTADDTPEGQSLDEPLDVAAVAEVIDRAELEADRADVPDKRFRDVRLQDIVRREIEAGLTKGSY